MNKVNNARFYYVALLPIINVIKVHADLRKRNLFCILFPGEIFDYKCVSYRRRVCVFCGLPSKSRNYIEKDREFNPRAVQINMSVCINLTVFYVQ